MRLSEMVGTVPKDWCLTVKKNCLTKKKKMPLNCDDMTLGLFVMNIYFQFWPQ